MSKIDITLSRDMTVNAGNYSSIKPSVSITIKDVDSKNTVKTYKALSSIMDSLMMLETVCLSDEMEAVQKMGHVDYKNMCANSIEATGGINVVMEHINKSIKQLEESK